MKRIPSNTSSSMLAPPTPMKKRKILFGFASVVCAILTLAVIITGVVVLAVYLAYRPKIPYIKVRDAHLDRLGYDQSGLLDVLMTVNIEAINANTKAGARFSDVNLELQFAHTTIAWLRADPFAVSKNSSVLLPYVVESTTVALNSEGMEKMDEALKQMKIPFDLGGQARTRWKVGVILSVRFWTHLHCTIQFIYPNGSTTGLDCTSKSH